MANQIVGLPLPIQVVDGQIADAAQLMGIGNYIAQQVNANSPGAQTLSACAVSFGSSTGLSTGVQVILGATASTPVVQFDVLSEFNTSLGRFVAVNNGYYWCEVVWNPTPSGITYNGFCGTNNIVNGGTIAGAGNFPVVNPVNTSANNPIAQGGFGCKLLAGQYIQINGTLTFSAGSATYGTGLISINRLS